MIPMIPAVRSSHSASGEVERAFTRVRLAGVSAISDQAGSSRSMVAERRNKDPMTLALAEAEAAAARGEVPVGAVLVDGPAGAILASSGNRVFVSTANSSRIGLP